MTVCLMYLPLQYGHLVYSDSSYTLPQKGHICIISPPNIVIIFVTAYSKYQINSFLFIIITQMNSLVNCNFIYPQHYRKSLLCSREPEQVEDSVHYRTYTDKCHAHRILLKRTRLVLPLAHLQSPSD